MGCPNLSDVRGPEAGSSTGRYQLVSVELAGYVLVVKPVADRTPMQARSRVAASLPVLYQRLHLLIGDLVAQLYRRVKERSGLCTVLAIQYLYRQERGCAVGYEPR